MCVCVCLYTYTYKMFFSYSFSPHKLFQRSHTTAPSKRLFCILESKEDNSDDRQLLTNYWHVVTPAVLYTVCKIAAGSLCFVLSRSDRPLEWSQRKCSHHIGWYFNYATYFWWRHGGTFRGPARCCPRHQLGDLEHAVASPWTQVILHSRLRGGGFMGGWRIRWENFPL